MKRPKRQSFLLPFLCLSALAAQEVPIQERTLPNGMRVILVERRGEPSISCGWVVKAGSADERPGITGIAHLFEHMMFKGTRTIGTRDAARDAELNQQQDRVVAIVRAEQDILREKVRRGEIQDIGDPKTRPPRLQTALDELETLVKAQRRLIVKDEFSQIYSQLGATGMNANTTSDRTFYHVDIPANKLELWAWLEADRMRNAVFREFYSERSVVLEERRMRTDATPYGRAMEAFNAMVWQAHPCRWPTLGWPSDITTITRDQADTFFATYYAPNNISLVLVGDLRAEEAFPLVQRYFGTIPANPVPPPLVTTLEPPQVGEQRMVAEAEAMPLVSVVHKTVPSVHRDAAPLKVLMSLLQGDSGRLKRSLILAKGAAVDAEAYSASLKYGGVFYLESVPAPGHTPEEMEALLLAEIRLIQEQGVTDRELQKVKNQMASQAFERIEHNQDLRDQIAEAEGAGTYKDFQAEPSLLQAVTREDVVRVARAYFTPQNRSVLIVHRRETK